uniref:Endoplasmic reticulum-Golgi intermediate compartment protein 3 n=1 Tax=Strongyloides venezuelensis TaxID=75913 RepID=A0A0K0FDJ3_STRVS
MGLITMIREYDLFAKPLDDFRIKTSFGGIISVLSFLTIATLFITETISFIHVKTRESLFIDYTPGDTNVTIYFDIAFHRLPCDFLSVDILDQGGQSQENIVDNVYKMRLDPDGNLKANSEMVKLVVNNNHTIVPNLNATTPLPPNYCGSCYGASTGCCNTCDEVREAYQLRGWSIQNLDNIEQCKNDPIIKLFTEREGEGCRVTGRAMVAKSGGNFHIAPGEGQSFRKNHMHILKGISIDRFNISHTINHLSFGEGFPDKKLPLNNKVFIDENGGIMHSYYAKIVPISYTYVSNKYEVFSYQFSATHVKKDILKAQSGLPGFFFIYEFSPIMVRYEEYYESFGRYAVNLCAIIGGVYTVAALVDSFAYKSIKILKKDK